MRLSRVRAVLFGTMIPLAVLAGCQDSDSVAGIPNGAPNGLYRQVLIERPTSATPEVRVSILSKPAGVRLGSYQAELSFDPEILRFESAAFPNGVDGAAELVSPGHLRFVGTALDGTESVALATVKFARTGKVAAEDFDVHFEEITLADLTDVTSLLAAGAPIVALVDH